MMRKICVVSSTRADWGLLSKLCGEINNDKDLKLQLIATAAHLVPEFGLSVEILKAKFKNVKSIPILLASDDKVSICKSMGLIQISFCEAFAELRPDIVVILGDRYEMLAVASTCLLMNIPIAHLCGGELSLGAIDDSIRHAISKMASLHFVTSEIYKKRVLQLGEEAWRVFNVGSFAASLIKEMKFLSKNELENTLKMKFEKDIFLITFHPQTLNLKQSKNEVEILLKNLANLKNASLVFTKANADESGLLINQILTKFCEKHKNAKLFDNLGSQKYLSLMKLAKAVVGNSSSGICEAVFFKTPCINIGDRQKGRLRTKNVIDTQILDLKNAFEKLESADFKANLKKLENPFLSGVNASVFTKDTLKNIDLKKLLNKKFMDM